MILMAASIFPVHSENITPKIKICPQPDYPSSAMRQELEGITKVNFLISEEGYVSSATILESSGHEILDLASINAIKNCSFYPIIENGVAKSQKSSMKFTWILDPEKARKIKKAEEAEKYKRWLETPEGKKYLTEQRIAEEVRAKQEQVQKIKAEKASILEKAEKEKMKQDCLKITAWGSDSRELIATALKVPMSSISLIRTQLGALDHCLAVIDTAKGPEKCRVMRIFQDRNTKEYAASFSDGIIPAYQAVCGPWAF